MKGEKGKMSSQGGRLWEEDAAFSDSQLKVNFEKKNSGFSY